MLDKLYIAVLDEVSDHMVPVLVAHAVLGAHLEWTTGLASDHLYRKYLRDSFRKCVLRVNRKEFEKIKALPHTYLGHENTVLNGEKSCAVVYPTYEQVPNVLKFAKMWKPLPTVLFSPHFTGTDNPVDFPK